MGLGVGSDGADGESGETMEGGFAPGWGSRRVWAGVCALLRVETPGQAGGWVVRVDVCAEGRGVRPGAFLYRQTWAGGADPCQWSVCLSIFETLTLSSVFQAITVCQESAVRT